MPHNAHTTSLDNKDLANGRTIDYYRRLVDDAKWEDTLPKPVVDRVRIDHHRTFNVVREDLVCGKYRFGDLLVSELAKKGIRELVYVAPRYGHAGIALAKLAAKHDMRLTLFMPACKEISDNQARAIELGAFPVFARVAAMPNLNRLADMYATAQKRASFVPLGLRHELVTAAAVRVMENMRIKPTTFWCAISTGVLNRAIQIAWPRASVNAVAVSRNIQTGERGSAQLFSHPREFAQDALVRPPFPSASNYDAKCWETMLQYAYDESFFWNVAGDDRAKDPKWLKLDAKAPWGVIRRLDAKWRRQITTRIPDFTDNPQ